MEEKYYKCYNADALLGFNPVDRIRDHIKRTDSIIKYLIELQKDVAPDYVEALVKRLLSLINDYKIDTNSFNLKAIAKELSYLKQGDLLTDLIIRYIAKELGLPEKSKIKSESAEFTNLSRAKAFEGFSYYRVKAFTDILGKKDGIKLYSKILSLIVKDMNNSMKINENDIIKARGERSVKRWCKVGAGDFCFKIFDDNKILYRFDKCVTHEALKSFNDPDVAYIASCFIGDIEEYNVSDFIHLRRTQTLHHGDFCDELYWDSRVHNNPEQPSLEYARKIGKT
ncbi:MAG: hypothetical protein HZR80_15565 [Candidatus Heimdallarchaeota archaeon]